MACLQSWGEDEPNRGPKVTQGEDHLLHELKKMFLEMRQSTPADGCGGALGVGLTLRVLSVACL